MRIGNWNWNFSNNGNFLNIRSGYWHSSCHWNFFKNWILYMMNIVLLIVFLNNRLSNEFFSRYLYCFCSIYILNLNSFCNWFKSNFFIRFSIYLQINFLPLNYRLNQSLLINFSTRSNNFFSSLIFSQYGFTSYWI